MPPRTPYEFEADWIDAENNLAYQEYCQNQVNDVFFACVSHLKEFGESGAEKIETMVATQWLSNPEQFKTNSAVYDIDYRLRQEFHSPDSKSPVLVEMRVSDPVSTFSQTLLVGEIVRDKPYLTHRKTAGNGDYKERQVRPSDREWWDIVDTIDFILHRST